MCDYSLAAMQTRLAVEGEELTVYRFPSGSLGLTSPAELERCKPELRGWRSWFNPRQAPCAVCIPPGARLQLEGFSPRAQEQFGVRFAESVTFTQTSCEPYTYRDAVRFENGRILSLQSLEEGLHARVLSLTGEELTIPVETAEPQLV